MKTKALILLITILTSCNNPIQKQIDYGSNPHAGKHVDINNIMVYYEVYGEGEPLLLLHGNGGSIEDFDQQIPTLAKHFKVIAVDSRAQGRTTDSDKEITYSLMASDMNELLNELKIESAYILGFSDGGNIGLELAFAHPEKVKKLITLGANFNNEDAEAIPDNVKMASNDPLIVNLSSIEKRKAEIVSKRPTPIPQPSPETKNKLKSLMEKYPTFTKEQLRQIKVPILVVSGDHDLINIHHTIQLFENLPHSQLFVVPGATHIALAEQPELINSEVIKFFSTPFKDINRYYFFDQPTRE
ncbi:MAG: alpha/beta hydrolase [Bacteroidetes bacterium]|nr:alpha/beta hydrolase [Bacteroidota bacterium]